MRIREIVTEASIKTARGFDRRKSDTMTATWAFPGMPSNNPYKAYRFAMAMANHQLQDTVGPADQFAVISAYTEGEQEIIDAARKKTGEPAVMIADRGSHEPQSTNKTSPVARPRPNRWGV